MRTCHFIRNKYQKRSLFITIVWSIFEYCREVWAPNYVVAEKKFEPIQKRTVKWIYGELNKKYTPEEYLQKLLSLYLLPIFNFFCLKKLKVFYKVKNELSHIRHYILYTLHTIYYIFYIIQFILYIYFVFYNLPGDQSYWVLIFNYLLAKIS